MEKCCDHMSITHQEQTSFSPQCFVWYLLLLVEEKLIHASADWRVVKHHYVQSFI